MFHVSGARVDGWETATARHRTSGVMLQPTTILISCGETMTYGGGEPGKCRYSTNMQVAEPSYKKRQLTCISQPADRKGTTGAKSHQGYLTGLTEPEPPP